MPIALLPDKQHLINFANVNKHAVRLRGSLTTTQWLKITRKRSNFLYKKRNREIAMIKK